MRSGFTLLELLLAATLGLGLAGLLLTALPAWRHRGTLLRREAEEAARVARALDRVARDCATIDPTRPPIGPEVLEVPGGQFWEWWVRPPGGGAPVLVRHRLQPGSASPTAPRADAGSQSGGGEWVREEWAAPGPDGTAPGGTPDRREVLLARVVRLVRHPVLPRPRQEIADGRVPAEFARALDLTTLVPHDSGQRRESVVRRSLPAWP